MIAGSKLQIASIICAWVLFVSSGVIAGLDFFLPDSASYVLFPSYVFIATTFLIRFKYVLGLIIWAPLALLLIVLAFTSVAWSDEPNTTLIESGRLLVHFLTAVSVVAWVGVRRALDLTFKVLALGCALSLLSLLNSDLSFGLHGDFRGVYQQKNILGFSGAMASMYAAHQLIFYRQTVRWFIVLMIGLAVIIYSDSASSLVLLSVAGATLIIQSLISRHGYVGPYKLLNLFMTLIALGYAANAMSEYVLDALGRDSTLTGRTALWQEGSRLISYRPILGYGYQSLSNENGALALYMMQRYGDYALQFHNSLINIRFQLGMPGLLLNILTIVSIFGICLKNARIGDPRRIVPLVTVIGICITLQSFSESTYGSPRSLQMMLIFVILLLPGEWWFVRRRFEEGDREISV